MQTLYKKTADADRKIVERVSKIALKHEVSMAQIALAWMLANPLVTAPIIGATKMQHLEDANAALAVKLSLEEITALEEFYVPHAVSGFS